MAFYQKHSEKSKLKISETRKRLFKEGKISSGFTKGHKINEGRFPSVKTKKLLSSQRKKLFKNGYIIWNKNLTKETDERIMISSIKSSNTHKKMVKKFLKAILKKPTALEMKLGTLTKRNRLPFRYTGNGTLLIGNKNPDFVCQTKRIALEIRNTKVCKYLAKMPYEQYKKERIKHFKKYGWKCLVFSEKDLKNKNKIISIIKQALSSRKLFDNS